MTGREDLEIRMDQQVVMHEQVGRPAAQLLQIINLWARWLIPHLPAAYKALDSSLIQYYWMIAIQQK